MMKHMAKNGAKKVAADAPKAMKAMKMKEGNCEQTTLLGSSVV